MSQLTVHQSTQTTATAQRRIAVIGSSGHAKVVIDLIERLGTFQVACLLDSHKRVGTELFGYRVCGTEADIADFVRAGVFDCAAIAIGDNWTRGRLAEKIPDSVPNLEFPVLVHPSARLSNDITIGRGTVIIAHASIEPQSRVGAFCILNTRSAVDHDAVVCDFASLGPASVVGPGVAIGKCSAIAIGARISQNLSIGDHTVIGAGAVVTADVPARVVAYGNPARTIRPRRAADPYLERKDLRIGRLHEGKAPTVVRPDKLTLVPSTSSKWEQYLEPTDHDFFHTSYCHRVSEFAGEGDAWLAVYGGLDKHLSWPFLVRPVKYTRENSQGLSDVTSVYGYAGPILHRSESDPEFLDAAWKSLRDYWTSQNVVSVFTRFHPILRNESIRLTEAYWLGSTVAIDVARSLSDVRADYRRQLKQQIRRCISANVEVLQDPEWRYCSEFISLYYETMIRNAAMPYYLFSAEYFRRLKAALGEHGRLVVAACDGEPASIALVIEHRRIVNIHLLGNSGRFYKLAPSKLLFDEIVSWAHQRGARYVHLGGGRGNRSDDELFRFKAQFSQLTYPFYVGKWILNREAYQDFSSQRKADAAVWRMEAIPGYFPAYRSPLRPVTESPKQGLIL